MRYLWFEGTNRKDLTHDELWGLLEAGRYVGLIWENSSARALGGYVAGVVDAELAEGQLKALGVPGAPVWFAVDFDVTGDEELHAVELYFHGVVDTLGRSDRVKVYGEYETCLWLMRKGLASGYWQTTAWSKGEWSPEFHMIQRVGTVQVGGTDADVNHWNIERYPNFDGLISREWTAGEIMLTQADIKAIATEVLFNTELQNAQGGTGYNLNTTIDWTNVYANRIPVLEGQVRALQELVVRMIAGPMPDGANLRSVIVMAFKEAAAIVAEDITVPPNVPNVLAPVQAEVVPLPKL